MVDADLIVSRVKVNRRVFIEVNTMSDFANRTGNSSMRPTWQLRFCPIESAFVKVGWVTTKCARPAESKLVASISPISPAPINRPEQ